MSISALPLVGRAPLGWERGNSHPCPLEAILSFMLNKKIVRILAGRAFRQTNSRRKWSRNEKVSIGALPMHRPLVCVCVF